MISKQLKFCLFQNFSKNSRPFRAKKRFIGTTNITYQLSKIEFPFFHQKSASLNKNCKFSRTIMQTIFVICFSKYLSKSVENQCGKTNDMQIDMNKKFFLVFLCLSFVLFLFCGVGGVAGIQIRSLWP